MYNQLLQLQKELDEIWKELNCFLDKEIDIKTRREEAELVSLTIREFWNVFIYSVWLFDYVKMFLHSFVWISRNAFGRYLVNIQPLRPV